MGVPHHSVKLDGVEKGDGMNGTPIGLNQDPLRVFQVVEDGKQSVLAISGEIYGGLSTKQSYQNYHLQFEFKWGQKKFEPRLQDKRDSGLLYHCQEPHGQFWNVWMRAPEMQVQETDCGDFHPLAGVSMDIRASQKSENGHSYWMYDPQGELRTFKSGPTGHCRRSANFENPHGEWNRLEVICLGDKAWHIVNGKVVMVLENAQEYVDGQARPLTSGKIQIQSEAAEAYYRNIRIRSISQLPGKFARQMR